MFFLVILSSQRKFVYAIEHTLGKAAFIVEIKLQRHLILCYYY